MSEALPKKTKTKKSPNRDLKMVLQTSNRYQNLGNSLLFHFVNATLSLLWTVFEFWRHKGGKVILSIWVGDEFAGGVFRCSSALRLYLLHFISLL